MRQRVLTDATCDRLLGSLPRGPRHTVASRPSTATVQRQTFHALPTIDIDPSALLVRGGQGRTARQLAFDGVERLRISGLLLAVVGLLVLLVGCGDPPRTVRLTHPDGFDIVRANYAAWEREYPAKARVERQRDSQAAAAAASRNGMRGWGAGLVGSEPEVVERCRRGLYDIDRREAWVIVDDPTALTEDERWCELHEIAHGVQRLVGWEAAAPLWAALPPRYRTHADINRRLDAWLAEQARVVAVAR